MNDKEADFDDAEFKKYSNLMEKSLQKFESIDEWQDIVGFLSRLSKLISSYKNFRTIPHEYLLSKRLSQTLNPSLPSGVHIQTLEVYELLLKTTCMDQQSIALWSNGLFPMGLHASTIIKVGLLLMKPILLDIYLKYYIPLGNDLKPLLKGFILAVLPFLEEENNELFEKVDCI